MSTSKGLLFLTIGLAALAAGGCRPSDAPEGEEAEPMPQASVVAEADTTGAAIWAHLQQSDYRSTWTLWPGKGELYTGQEPHGMLLTTYLNDVALQALSSGAASMAPGAIIVKENYMPDGTLAAVTTMFKVGGYNPDVNDWFFTKHLASGELDRTPGGMAMEGRLPGCTNCHTAMQANDYLFTGQLGGGGVDYDRWICRFPKSSGGPAAVIQDGLRPNRDARST